MNYGECVTSNVLVPNPRYGICREAEPRLEMSLQDEALIVVNGLMLFKACGDTVGLALHETRLQGGVIELATWYEINYDNSQPNQNEIIRQAFIAGETHVQLPGVTRWHMLRAVIKESLTTNDDLTERLNKAANSLTKNKQLPDSIDRQDYFDDNMLYFKRVRNLGIGLTSFTKLVD